MVVMVGLAVNGLAVFSFLLAVLVVGPIRAVHPYPARSQCCSVGDNGVASGYGCGRWRGLMAVVGSGGAEAGDWGAAVGSDR